MLLAALGIASRGGDHGPHVLFRLLLLALVGTLIVMIVRRLRGGGHHHHRHGSAMQTLQERFARGEIDQAEFDHRKAVLEGADDVPPAPTRPAPAPPTPEPTETEGTETEPQAPDLDSEE